MDRWLAGRLLVASPLLTDPNFGRAVVLLLAHSDDDGALGVVLNRPSGVDIDAVMPGWEALAAKPSVIFVGGPVDRSSLICLAERREGVGDGEHGRPLVGETVVAIDLHRDPGEVSTTVNAVRLFSGYAGWRKGQLEAELEEKAWFVLDADPGDPFTLDTDDLWETVLTRAGGKYRIVAKAPPDLRMN